MVQTDDLTVDEVAAVIVEKLGLAVSEVTGRPLGAAAPAEPVTVRVASGSPV